MSKELRLGDRLPLEGTVEVYFPGENDVSWYVEGKDVSPTAIAIIVSVDNGLMDHLPRLFRPGKPVMVHHELFGTKKCVLHRVFSHRGENTKWVLSFLKSLNFRELEEPSGD